MLPRIMGYSFSLPSGMVQVKEITITGATICLSRIMRKPKICICKNRDAGQLRGNREADQRLCFRYKDSTNPVLSKSKISSF